MDDVLGSQSTEDIEAEISLLQYCLSIYPRSHPLRPIVTSGLAIWRLRQNRPSNQREDLDESILHLTESILLPPCSWLEHGPMILEVLFFLAFALLKRLTLFGQPEDAVYAVKYLRYLRDQPHQTFGIPRHLITTLLVHLLAAQVEAEAGNMMQNIGEMAVLCHELLTLDISDIDTTPSVTVFASAVLSKIKADLWVPVPDQLLDQVIECLRAARKHKPDLHKARFALAFSLCIRYYMTFMDDDYEEAASVMDEVINSRSLGDSRDIACAQRIVAMFAMIRSRAHSTPEHLEEEIYRTRAFHNSSPEEQPSHYLFDYSLEHTARQRFRYFGSTGGLAERSGSSQFSQLVAAFVDDKGDDLEFGRMNKNYELLGGLLSGIRDSDITKIDEDIETGRTILASSDPIHPFTPDLSHIFANILFEGFYRTNKIEYLNESISTMRWVLERPVTLVVRLPALSQLSLSLLARFASFPDHCTQDLDEGLELLSQCANDARASLPERFQFACLWASVARLARHPSISTAYENALTLMQNFLLFAPTLQLQHTTLATSNHSHSMPLDYASYQVDLRQLEEAIVTLERGRALLWSEMRHLRASIDHHLHADSQLGHEFVAVNRDLEELTKSIPPSHKLSVDDGATDDLRAADPFGRLLLKQRGLWKKRDKLISKIQALPGFDSFLTSPPFDTLRSAASSGPVIIINHSRWRSDILILHNTSLSLVPTPDDFYDRASILKNKLFDSRRIYGLDSSHYNDALASVLAELYKLVGKPVIDRLRQLEVPEQSRIWWCPTSVFCSLPLHAMGPISPDDEDMRYFLDLYICSYTPTLSALIQSRSCGFGSRSLNRPSILLVAQPDPSLPTVGGEIGVVQALDTEVTSLISEAATPTAVTDGFQHHQFVHFACHGTLEAGKPFEAGFELYGGERLTLLEIVRSHLPAAEFAFLSACHTAEVTEESIVDEVLHLAAAVQYCGFRSVVGTMWAMVDEDGRDLAEHFYKALFSNSRRDQGTPYHERSAKALRFAVKKLRDRRKRRVTLERWVNFVHYGA